jgi:hypothetical protein
MSSVENGYNLKTNPAGFVNYRDLKVGDRVELDDGMQIIPGGVYVLKEGPVPEELVVAHPDKNFNFHISQQVDDPADDVCIGVWKFPRS